MLTFREASRRITELGDRLDIAIFFGPSYSFTNNARQTWSLSLKHRNDGVETKIDVKAFTLEDAILEAWTKLEKIMTEGHPIGALIPTMISDNRIFKGSDADDTSAQSR